MEKRDQIKVYDHKLTRRCSGYRTKMFVKVYELTLYTEKQYENTNDIFNTNDGFLIEMKFLMNIPNEKIKQNMLYGFHNNTSENGLLLINDDINIFLAIFDNVIINSNDQLCINYDSVHINIRLTTNNGIKTVTINNHHFKNSLLRIWLGNKPVDKNLKNTIIRGLAC